MSYPVDVQVIAAIYYPSIGFETAYSQNFRINMDPSGSQDLCPASSITTASLTASAIFYIDNKMAFLNSTHAVILNGSDPSANPLSTFKMSSSYAMPPATAMLRSNSFSHLQLSCCWGDRKLKYVFDIGMSPLMQLFFLRAKQLS